MKTYIKLKETTPSLLWYKDSLEYYGIRNKKLTLTFIYQKRYSYNVVFC